jgi:hypothetical protein
VHHGGGDAELFEQQRQCPRQMQARRDRGLADGAAGLRNRHSALLLSVPTWDAGLVPTAMSPLEERIGIGAKYRTLGPGGGDIYSNSGVCYFQSA